MAISAFALVVIFGTTTWAALSLIKPHDHPSVNRQGIESIKPVLPEESRSRAPEPTTLALFGSGIFGMMVGFVRKIYQKVKRLFDIVAAAMGIILASPICLFLAVLIKLTSRGPIIYQQTRVGKNGQLFTIYKFRTMHVDAEDHSGPVWASDNDKRLIPLGGLIRKTHMDEIPQFVNILKGDMSLIGPRPERPMFVDEFKKVIPDYEKRLKVKPGITGLAQVWHKYDESINDVKKKIKYDLLYIRKLCLWTDLTIIVRTIRVVLTGEGAR